MIFFQTEVKFMWGCITEPVRISIFPTFSFLVCVCGNYNCIILTSQCVTPQKRFYQQSLFFFFVDLAKICSEHTSKSTRWETLLYNTHTACASTLSYCFAAGHGSCMTLTICTVNVSRPYDWSYSLSFCTMTLLWLIYRLEMLLQSTLIEFMLAKWFLL